MSFLSLLIGTFVLGSTFGVLVAAFLVQPFSVTTVVVGYGLGFVGALFVTPYVDRHSSS